MEHSKMYYTIKDYYNEGYWNIDRVREAVVKGRITEAEFKEITGEDY